MLRLEQSDVSGVPGIPLEQPRAESPTDPATIGKSLVIKGEIRGNESLYVDGKVQGVIHLLGNRSLSVPPGRCSQYLRTRNRLAR
jgi:hypothetical protein